MADEKSKPGFVFFESFDDCFQQIPDDAERLRLFDAIRDYCFRGITPDLQYPLAPMFSLLKASIDVSLESRRSGSKGGRPSKAGTTETPVKTPVKTPLKTPDTNPPINQEKRSEEKRSEGESIFAPPTREEVLAFFKEHNCSTGERYFRKYSATGWKTANNVQIQDWKDHALNWIDEEPTRKTKNGDADTQTRRRDKPDWDK